MKGKASVDETAAARLGSALGDEIRARVHTAGSATAFAARRDDGRCGVRHARDLSALAPDCQVGSSTASRRVELCDQDTGERDR